MSGSRHLYYGLVTSYRVRDEQVAKCGILEVEEGEEEGEGRPRRIVGFVEKPLPTETASRLACPCFYYLKAQSLHLLEEFLKEKRGEGAALADMDATGKFVGWLVQKSPVYAASVSGRLDIGGLESYIQADSYVSRP
ncbi:hypothetical protein BDK51DRAFT_38641 [Blyttiomyces helicus]|uniref:Uncharacterized protein n=1 Tax=Blyttiomyces helicus TaxID=388810 RepID=A0A4P9VZN6_9FUNG|nr:hypothetical protein BDK51DRAFT_38641 [Blyttiomyces helicus]|eukprot:RKO84485.1 hypothetical protein BDK51DRAFT_38641 [Blyttiomyces helicus]